MDILTYSPKVEAYVAVTGKDGKTSAYYDLSQDITSCSITRELDAASSFTIKLQNKNGKYNGIFTPMDRVLIFATGADGKRYQQLTGYIKKVDRFTLFASDFTIEGRDVMYQLQELWWDPDLTASQELLIRTDYYKSKDAGFSGVIKALLVDVAGWNENRIYISPTLPDEVINWAYELYEAQKSDIADTKTMVEDFYNIMATSGLLTGGSSNGSSGGTAGNADVEAACKWAIDIANNDQYGYVWGGSHGDSWDSSGGDCSAFVCHAFKDGGGFNISITSTYYMKDTFTSAGFKWYDRSAMELSGYSKLQRGDILLNIQKHTELYIGDGQVVGAHTSSVAKADQISCKSYWDDKWDGILRYEG